MTLLPAEPARISVPPQDFVFEGVPSICQVPGCFRRAQGSGGHHIVRRSFTSGPRDFVSIDGLVLPNRVSICDTHHDLINDNKAWVRYFDGGWWWFLPKDNGSPVMASTKAGTVFYCYGKLKEARWNPATDRVECVA